MRGFKKLTYSNEQWQVPEMTVRRAAHIDSMCVVGESGHEELEDEQQGAVEEADAQDSWVIEYDDADRRGIGSS